MLFSSQAYANLVVGFSLEPKMLFLSGLPSCLVSCLLSICDLLSRGS